MTDTKTPAFNAASDAFKWPEETYRVIANWWTDRLPKEYQTGVGTDIMSIEIITATVTPAQRAAFTEALVDELKQVPPSKSPANCLYVTNADNQPPGATRAPSTPLKNACARAGIPDVYDEMKSSIVETRLYTDGQLFAAGQPLAYGGQPATPFIKYGDIDFTGALWFRQESRMMIVELEAGQKVQLPRRAKDGTLTYVEREAKGDDVLVIHAAGTEGYDSLTAADALDLRSHPNVTSASVCLKSSYKEGKGYDGTLEKLDNKGHYRMVSHPLQLLEAKQTFLTGWSIDYKTVNPGDFVSRMEMDRGHRHFVLPKAAMERGLSCFIPCTPGGETLEMNALDKPITAGKPLKLTPGKTPA
ncbi:MAG: hypothetical protein ACAH80_09545 [Alphaproteobacteria bacterium]